MEAAILCVGDELLEGATPNSNGHWLASRLTRRGVDVKRILVLPDRRGELVEEIRTLQTRYDVLLVTGGVGGTPDDLTMESVAEALRVPLEVNDRARRDVEKTVEQLRTRYEDISIDIEAQATLPAGCRPLINHVGLSPGCVAENVYVFPGIPEELKDMFKQVEEEFRGPLRSRSAYTQTPEGNLLELLDTLRDRFKVSVGCYPDPEKKYSRIRLTASDEDALEQAYRHLIDHSAVSETPPVSDA